MLKFISRRSDLPLDHDAHSRFLPWLIAFMVFLANLAMVGMLMLNTVAERWDQGGDWDLNRSNFSGRRSFRR